MPLTGVHTEKGESLMGTQTRIEWTDNTFSPWRGCHKVSPGCANCYAETQSKRNPKVLGIWGPQGTRPIASAKSEFEAELRNVEVYCAIQVSDGKVHFVEPTMELLCWREMAGSVQGLTRKR